MVPPTARFASPVGTGIAMTESNGSLKIQDRPFARKLSAFVRLSPDDMQAMSNLYRRRRRFPVGNDMIHQGQENQSAYVLASGWASSCKILPDGTRQIVDFQIPGDFLGLRSILFRTSDHNVAPISTVQASEVRQQDLLDAFARPPDLRPQCSGRHRGTRPWWSNIGSMSGAARPLSEWYISCWTSDRVWNWSILPPAGAMPAPCRNAFWPMPRA
jgi:hypothetical protein